MPPKRATAAKKPPAAKKTPAAKNATPKKATAATAATTRPKRPTAAQKKRTEALEKELADGLKRLIEEDEKKQQDNKNAKENEGKAAAKGKKKFGDEKKKVEEEEEEDVGKAKAATGKKQTKGIAPAGRKRKAAEESKGSPTKKVKSARTEADSCWETEVDDEVVPPHDDSEYVRAMHAEGTLVGHTDQPGEMGEDVEEINMRAKKGAKTAKIAAKGTKTTAGATKGPAKTTKVPPKNATPKKAARNIPQTPKRKTRADTRVEEEDEEQTVIASEESEDEVTDAVESPKKSEIKRGSEIGPKEAFIACGIDAMGNGITIRYPGTILDGKGLGDSPTKVVYSTAKGLDAAQLDGVMGCALVGRPGLDLDNGSYADAMYMDADGVMRCEQVKAPCPDFDNGNYIDVTNPDSDAPKTRKTTQVAKAVNAPKSPQATKTTKATKNTKNATKTTKKTTEAAKNRPSTPDNAEVSDDEGELKTGQMLRKMWTMVNERKKGEATWYNILGTERTVKTKRKNIEDEGSEPETQLRAAKKLKWQHPELPPFRPEISVDDSDYPDYTYPSDASEYQDWWGVLSGPECDVRFENKGFKNGHWWEYNWRNKLGHFPDRANMILLDRFHLSDKINPKDLNLERTIGDKKGVREYIDKQVYDALWKTVLEPPHAQWHLGYDPRVPAGTEMLCLTGTGDSWYSNPTLNSTVKDLERHMLEMHDDFAARSLVKIDMSVKEGFCDKCGRG